MFTCTQEKDVAARRELGALSDLSVGYRRSSDLSIEFDIILRGRYNYVANLSSCEYVIELLSKCSRQLFPTLALSGNGNPSSQYFDNRRRYAFLLYRHASVYT